MSEFPRDDEGHRLIKNVRPEMRLQHPWPDDCFVQGGKGGVVFVRGGDTYTTAFVEACPRDPDTFIRGEGETVELAEDAAWSKFQKYRVCPSPSGQHDPEPRGYRNGAGFCSHCGMFVSRAFALVDIGSICVICAEPTYWRATRGLLTCEEHSPPSYFEICISREEALERLETIDVPDGLNGDIAKAYATDAWDEYEGHDRLIAVIDSHFAHIVAGMSKESIATERAAGRYDD